MKLILLLLIFGQYDLYLARVKYRGGDWYNDPDMLVNLAQELNKRTTLRVYPRQVVVDLKSDEIFNYPFLFLTGHGDIQLSDEEVSNLRKYLTSGGFLYADDDYGMDKYFRREMKKVFPNLEFVELPFDHPIYHILYDFPNGPPKIHKHTGKPPKGYGIFYQGRLVVYYTYESNVSDGWTAVHNDPPEKREQAFRMGINIVLYALTQ